VKPIDPTIAEEALAAVTGPRQRDYAHPKVNFQRIADLWSPILGVKVTPEQVALCMIQVKVGRLMNRYTRDSVVDILGYALTLDACREDQ
jgi:hypothetical protein